MVFLAIPSGDARLFSLPGDLSLGQRWGVAFAVVLTHAGVATWVWQTSRSTVVLVEEAPLMVSLITEATTPTASTAPSIQPVLPAVRRVAPTPVPRPTRPTPRPLQRQTPPVVASEQAAQAHEFQVPVAVKEPVPKVHDVAASQPRVVSAPSMPGAAQVNSSAQTLLPTAVGAVADSAAAPIKTLPSSAVRFLIKPAPIFPPTSKELGESGTVAMRILVAEQGRAKEVEVTKSPGYPRLDRAAIVAERAARFQPYLNAGLPMPHWAPHSITFNLTSHDHD